MAHSSCSPPAGGNALPIEPEPFFGANESELQECVDEGFDLLSYAEVTFNGKTTTDLDDYVVTTELDTLPANNLLGPDAGLTLDKGYYLVIHPLSPGTHTLRAYDEFESLEFTAGITFTIIVG